MKIYHGAFIKFCCKGGVTSFSTRHKSTRPKPQVNQRKRSRSFSPFSRRASRPIFSVFVVYTRRSLFPEVLFLFATRYLFLAAAISLWRHLVITKRAIRSNRAPGRRRRDVCLPFLVSPFVSLLLFFHPFFLFSSLIDTRITEAFLLYLFLQVEKL